jgi:hypothetical protein
LVGKPVKKLLLAAGLGGWMAAELLAQGGLAGPPGRMGGGARGASGARAAQPSGQIPATVPASDGGAGRSVAAGSGDASPSSASRPSGNILFPGTPGPSTPGSISSPGLPGLAGQTSILSPGFPGPYRPGNILTPGTPRPGAPPAPHAGGIYSSPGVGTGRFSDSAHGRGRFQRHGGSVIVYPYFYYGDPYAYGNGGYAIDAGGVSRTSSSANYTIEGHLDQTSPREPQSRVYEVGPGADEPDAADGPAAPDAPSGEAGAASAEPAAGVAEPAEGAFYLIALKGGLIYTSREQWLLGNTVHFVTLQGDHYVVSLQELDLDLSVQLNRERGLKLVLEVREHGQAAAGSAVNP